MPEPRTQTQPQRSGGRYAIYFTHEPSSPWGRAGARWIGRSLTSREACGQTVPLEVNLTDFLRWTSSPRRYGWHATLKAPFALAQGVDESALMRAVEKLAQGLVAFDMPALSVAWLGDFLALVDPADTPALKEVAQACVTQLHPLASPLSLPALQRRRASGLSAREDELLLRWGYPYVLDCFRFHLSLTGPMPEAPADQRAAVQQAAQAWFAGLPPARFDALSVFWEPEPGSDFQCLARVGLGC